MIRSCALLERASKKGRVTVYRAFRADPIHRDAKWHPLDLQSLWLPRDGRSARHGANGLEWSRVSDEETEAQKDRHPVFVEIDRSSELQELGDGARDRDLSGAHEVV